MQPVFEAENITVLPRIHRPATFIEHAIHHVLGSLYTGGVLVTIILILFFFHWRTAFISLTAIPLSLLVAIVVLDIFHITLNTITLGGLEIAIGEVVDVDIIDMENIYRLLRENRALGNPKPLCRSYWMPDGGSRRGVVRNAGCRPRIHPCLTCLDSGRAFAGDCLSLRSWLRLWWLLPSRSSF
jgi:hypothetical protein